ncbi:MAG: TrmH family RNA methyltransferase [Armatimonadota bacterium]
MIQSTHNQHVRRLRSLATRKGRRTHGQFLVEGVRALEEARAGGLELATVAWCPQLASSARARELAGELAAAGARVLEMSERAFRAFTQVQAPEGLAAAVTIPDTSLADIPVHADLLVAAVDVRDPGNLGALLRTADAAGAQAFIAAGSCADLYDPKVVRATAGSIFHLMAVSDTTVEKMLDWARASGVSSVAATVEGARPHTAIRYPARALVMVGNEANGLPTEVAREADLRACIAMPGRAESLNVAVAAGILLWEILRQRGRDNDCDGEE